MYTNCWILINNFRFLQIEILWDKFGTDINIINLYNVQRAIPKEWLRTVKMNIKNELDTGIHLVTNQMKCSKVVYNYLNAKKKDTSTGARHKWEVELNYEIIDSHWSSMFGRIRRLTLSTKLRLFQYRIVHRYLVTNKMVCKWAKDVSSKCSLCGQEEETIVHLLVKCPESEKMWKALSKWLKYFCNIDFSPDVYTIVMNDYKDSFKDMINCIILVTKYYIYVQRCLRNRLKFTEVIQAITKYKNIEKKVAHKLKLTDKHNNKWHMYDMI